MAKYIIDIFKGTDTTTANLLQEKGELTFSQNVRTRPFKNLAKRKAVEHVDSDTNPIMGIFDIELDGIIIPVLQAGGTLTFYPDLASASANNPDPYPSPDPLDPTGGGVFTLFPIEKTMRALNERFARTDNIGVVFPPAIFGPSGILDATIPANAYTSVTDFPRDLSYFATKTVTACPNESLSTYFTSAPSCIVTLGVPGPGCVYMPTNGFYGYDLAQWDSYFGQPAGTRGKELVNMISSGNTVWADGSTGIKSCSIRYVRNITTLDKTTAILFYDTASPTIIPIAATASTYKQRLVDCRSAIRKFEWYSLSASWGSTNAYARYFVDFYALSTFANAQACAITNYPVITDGVSHEYHGACVFFAAAAAPSAAFGGAVGSTDPGNPDLTFQTYHNILTGVTTNYPKILNRKLFALIIAGGGTYYSPSGFGSPAVNTYNLMGSGANSFQLSQAVVDADLAGIVGALIETPSNSVGWASTAGNLIIQLGPFTYNV